MIRDTWLLLLLRWQLGWNRFKKGSLPARIFTVVGGIVVAVVPAVISAGIGVGAGLLMRAQPELQLDALIPSVILSAVTMLLLLSSFGVALGALFLSSDLELLMAAPVSRRAVFTSKILDGMLWYYAIIAVVALPALITYGIGLGYGPLYYLMVVLSVLAMPLLPAALAAILVMLVARFAPARRVREVLGALGAVFGISCGLLGQTMRFWFPDTRRSSRRQEFEELAQGFRDVTDLPIPPMMAGRGLAAAGQGEVGAALIHFGAFTLFTVGFFILCVLLAENLYAAGWVRMQSSGSAKRSKQKAAKAARNSGLLGRASATLAITLKDWRVIPRDLRNFAQLLAPLLFLPVFYFNVITAGGRRNPNGREQLPPMPFLGEGVDFSGVYAAGGILFAAIMVFGRVAETSISMEGKSWWLLKAAPLSPGELLRGKLLAALVPFIVVSTLLMIGAAILNGFDPVWGVYGWLGVQVLGAGMLAIGIGLAVPWARLAWDDPRKMSTWQSSVLSLVGWVILGIVGGLVLCIPVLMEALDPALVPLGFVMALALAAAISGGIGYLAMRLGVSRLSNVGEA